MGSDTVYIITHMHKKYRGPSVRKTWTVSFNVDNN